MTKRIEETFSKHQVEGFLWRNKTQVLAWTLRA